MVCTFDTQPQIRKKLEFSCSDDWADITCAWDRECSDSRKRKMKDKKDHKPPKCFQSRKTARTKMAETSKPRIPQYLKALESRSAGPNGRFDKRNPFYNPMEANKEPVKCKVVSFTGFGPKLCVSTELRVHRVSSVPNVNDQWNIDGALFADGTSYSSRNSYNSSINLDSGHKQDKFQKEQLLSGLHGRSASLLKYLFARGDGARTNELHLDNISLPIRTSNPRTQPPRHKHVILPPRGSDDCRFGEDYVGSLIPNPARPLGYGLLASQNNKPITLSHKTLEFPDVEYRTGKFLLPPFNNTAAPVRSCVENVKVDEGPSYVDSVSQLVGLLCIESTATSLPRHTIQKWLDT